MADDKHSAFKPITTQFQQKTPSMQQLEEREQFASLSSVASQDLVQSSDDTSSAPRQEDSSTMAAACSCFKKAACSCVKGECESHIDFTEEKQELGQELLGSVDEEVTACDLVSGFSGWEEKGIVCEKKMKAFGVEVEETENSEVGCLANFEKTLKDSVKREVGCSGIQECGEVNEKKESEVGGEMVSEFSGCEGNGVVCDRKVQAFGLEVEESENSEVGCVATFEKTSKDFVKLEVSCSAVQECDNFNEEESEVKVETSSVVEGDNEDRKEMKSEALLEAKKKQLLAELEVSGLASQEVHKLVQNNGVKIDGARVSDVSVRPSLRIEVIDDTALIETVRVPKVIERNGKKGETEQEVDGKKARRSRRKAKDAKKASEMSEKIKNLTDYGAGQDGGLKDGKQEKIMYSRKEMEALRFVNIVEQRKMWRDVYTGLGPVVMTEYDDLFSSKHQKHILLNFDPRQNFSRKPETHEILALRSSLGTLEASLMRLVSSKTALTFSKEVLLLQGEEGTISISLCVEEWPRAICKVLYFRISQLLLNFLLLSGEEYSQNVDNESEHMDGYEVNVDILNPGYSASTEGEGSYMVKQGECSEEYDSDEDYSSIQRPAFLVEGEPDFDSGPPGDGLEYLRRVRWEAAHIPRVKVAKRDQSKPSKEQSVYMPRIPDIPRCPEHLMPLKEWEDSFLADFSKLRQVLSGIENPSSQLAGKLQDVVIFHKDNESCQLPDSTIAKTDELHSCQPVDSFSHKIAADEPSLLNTEDDEISPCHPNPKTSPIDDSTNHPTLSAILKMDSVARVSMLRKRITSIETFSTLSRNDCVWLFSLCATVDTPLDADTSAAFRSLLRKCARLRAGKSELDDEVVMLNILATISGRYFGQAED
ncbi:hypothetical protein Pint_25708 [Pistacia integerrima]|uniref:Uncharacterized protein n=1 Tax=Pistacia integerrima TaxID=434235 RepID=A0ACC0YE04_9ROSI|nr:hypothetical protein Pint_25708 [Pistacia integerrima]